MIDRLQQHLSDIYQVGGVHDVRDFLITDPRLAQCIGAGSMLSDTSETLLMSEDAEGLALSLFVDGELLSRLESADPLSRLRADLLDDPNPIHADPEAARKCRQLHFGETKQA